MNTNELFQSAFKAVESLDLERIKMKLMHGESGEGWSQQKADAVEREYRRFLCLMKMYPDEDTAPLVDVDTFWHYHILDTMKYAVDCEQVFRYFLHHYPYVGLRGGDDERFRIDSGDRMRSLYEATFGESYPGWQGDIDPAATAYCAGPHIEKVVLGAPTAYCAGPHASTAYCAGPHITKLAASAEGAVSAATAYCAGPHAKVAYCAGPHIAKLSPSPQAAATATAYCAGPHAKLAYCAGPHAKVAYCAGPHIGRLDAGSSYRS